MPLFHERITHADATSDPTSPEARKFEDFLDHVAQEQKVLKAAIKGKFLAILATGSVIHATFTDNNRVERWGWDELPPPAFEKPDRAAA